MINNFNLTFLSLSLPEMLHRLRPLEPATGYTPEEAVLEFVEVSEDFSGVLSMDLRVVLFWCSSAVSLSGLLLGGVDLDLVGDLDVVEVFVFDEDARGLPL